MILEQLRPYQRDMLALALDQPRFALWADPGLGKTLAAYTAIHELVLDRYAVSRALVVAPKYVAQMTWPDEAAKWGFPTPTVLTSDHFERVIEERMVNGELIPLKGIVDPAKVRRRIAASLSAVTTVSYNDLYWLARLFAGARWPFDMVIFDESQMVKNPGTKVHSAARAVARKATRVGQLTGTPSPNRIGDLYGQFVVLDGGRRLGSTQSLFRSLWMRQTGRFRYEAIPGVLERMAPLIADIVRNFREEDWLQLPELVVNDVWVDMPGPCHDLDRLVRAKRLGDEVLANGGVVVAKRRQVASGAYLDADGAVHEVHDAKLRALESLLSVPTIVLYEYRHSAERIARVHKGAQRVTPASIDAWNRGEVQILLAHPEEIARGLNLQTGGHQMVWFDPTYNSEHWRQMIKRLHRSGQRAGRVLVHRILTRGSIDPDVVEVCEAKVSEEEALRRLIDTSRPA